MKEINPCSVANGTATKQDVKDTLIEQVQTNHLLPLDALRFLRTMAKASGEAEKVKDDDKLTIADKALIQAEGLPELQKALSEGRKEFIWNGCSYQYKTEIKNDLSDESGQYAQDWKRKKKQVDELADQIADLKSKQDKLKVDMEEDAAKHIKATKGKYQPKITHSIAVL